MTLSGSPAQAAGSAQGTPNRQSLQNGTFSPRNTTPKPLGTTPKTLGTTPKTFGKMEVEVVELDDDEDDVQELPVSKK